MSLPTTVNIRIVDGALVLSPMEPIVAQSTPENKSVREKLKEVLLKTQSNAVGQKPVFITSIDEQPQAAVVVKHHQTEVSSSTTPARKKIGIPAKASEITDEKSKYFERNREAAKRYRNKIKSWHTNVKQRNIELEIENARMKVELEQMKAFLLAHQDCSVSRAMAQGIYQIYQIYLDKSLIHFLIVFVSGMSIPVGVPKVVMKSNVQRQIAVSSPSNATTKNHFIF